MTERTASWIATPERWTRQLDIDAVFGRRAPLEVEIGCGKGRFLVERARSHPGIDFLGVDRLLRRLRKADRKATAAGLSNVRLLRIEGSYAVKYLLPKESVSVFYLFFPDPWPKRRHHRRRLLTPGFVDSLHCALVPDGLLYVNTDHLDYFEWVCRTMAADPRFTDAPPFLPSEEERTEFEAVFLAHDAPIHRGGFRRLA